ncbi:MAG TPA: hypothetical protein VNC50_10290, partial [Planctomycetia bacterium]|nr:hypothetical protein [Planctomycetia bacterium]
MSTGLFADEVLDFMDEVAGAASTHTPADGWDMPAFENTPSGRRAESARQTYPTARGLAARTARFPEDRSIGVVLLSPDGRNWHEIGPARGAVDLPAGVAAMVRMAPGASVGDLRRLGPEDLQGLEAVGVRLSDKDAEWIGRLRGLKTLDLSWTALGDLGLARLGDLDRLETLRLAHTRIADGAAEVLAKLPRLRTLVLRGTAAGDRLAGSLRGHPSPRNRGFAATDDRGASRR